MRQKPDHIEAPGSGQESVWDYPRPPRVEPVDQKIKVEFAGMTIAETVDGYRVLETGGPPTYYIPPKDVRTEYLERTSHSTVCEWKGQARYFSVRVGDQTVENAAWCYPNPIKGFQVIKDYLAFYAFKMDACYAGDQKVDAQPGQFYGGWITPNIVGPFKGDPGTENW